MWLAESMSRFARQGDREGTASHDIAAESLDGVVLWDTTEKSRRGNSPRPQENTKGKQILHSWRWHQAPQSSVFPTRAGGDAQTVRQAGVSLHGTAGCTAMAL